MTPHLERSHCFVGPDVEDGLVVVRPREAVVRVVDLIREVDARSEVTEMQDLALAAVVVVRVRDESLVG